jgi:hypothetical protein
MMVLALSTVSHIYAVFSCLIGATIVVSGDGRYFSKDAVQVFAVVYSFLLSISLLCLYPILLNMYGFKDALPDLLPTFLT